MIDFVKFKLTNASIAQFEANPYLEFKTIISTQTGEISKFKSAYYKGLKFTIIEPFGDERKKSMITLEGSLHKFWNNGKHNYNDFGMKEIKEVQHELKQKFNVEFKTCILKQLEIGLNIIPSYNIKTILASCIMHKTKRFKSLYVKDEGEYIQVYHQQYIVKIYNKSKHYTKQGYDIKDKILRFELKFNRMNLLHKINVYTLEDLVYSLGFAHGLYLLRQEWKNVLFYDFKIFTNSKYENIYSNPIYWENLNYGRFKYHRKNLDNIVNKNCNSVKKSIDNDFTKKFKILFPKTDYIISI